MERHFSRELQRFDFGSRGYFEKRHFLDEPHDTAAIGDDAADEGDDAERQNDDNGLSCR